MEAYQKLTTSLEVTNRAKEMVKGEFTIVTAREADLTEAEQACIRVFNSYWDTKVYPLAIQVRYLLIKLFRASQYQPHELGEGPRLSLCARIKKAKERFDLVEHVETIYIMTMDTVFNVPKAEASDNRLRKCKRVPQQSVSPPPPGYPHISPMRCF